jgi:DnaJ-like protein
MLIYLGLGVLVLALGLLLLRAFVAADPVKLARAARTALITAAVAIAILALILFIVSERFALGVAEVAALAPLLLRAWAQWRRQQGASPSPGGASDVETDYLRMHLDHGTGTMSGTVLRGRFQGRRLDELSLDELMDLWRECRVVDSEAAKLLEAYLDRGMPDWREASGTGGGTRMNTGDPMTRQEALAVLGLQEGASEEEIRDVYRRLMLKIHPDKGGSAYFAAKLNRARETLLG